MSWSSVKLPPYSVSPPVLYSYPSLSGSKACPNTGQVVFFLFVCLKGKNSEDWLTPHWDYTDMKTSYPLSSCHSLASDCCWLGAGWAQWSGAKNMAGSSSRFGTMVLISCVPLGNSLTCLEPEFLRFSNGNTRTPIMEVLQPFFPHFLTCHFFRRVNVIF